MNHFAFSSAPATTPTISFDFPTSWQELWNRIANFFTTNVWNIIKFFSILLIGILVIWLIMFGLRRFMKRKDVDPMAIRFTCTILRFVLALILIFILLGSMGIEITGFTTAVSAAFLAVGMALKENLSNLANGLILVGSKKYKTGDYIVVGSVEGSIVEIGFLFTTLTTPDGKQVMMPNSIMVNSQVTNIGANPRRRVGIDLPVAYESDVDKVKEIVISVMKSNGKVYLEPAPFCALKSFGDSAIVFFCNCWCDTEDYWDVYYYLMENIYNELKRNNISIPYQQIEVRERTDHVVMPLSGELGKRIEKQRKARKKQFDIDQFEDTLPLQVLKEVHDQKQKEEEQAKKKSKKQK